MSELDDGHVIGAMRAFLAAVDALDAAAVMATAEGSRDVIDKADAKTLAEMTLRKHLRDAGWVAPRAVPADNDS